MNVLKGIGAGVAALVAVGVLVVVGLAVGFLGWQLNWWYANQNTSRTAHMYQNSYGTQSAYVEEARQAISQIDSEQVQITSPQTPATEKSALQSQESAQITQVCGIIDNITLSPMPLDLASFNSANCG